MRQRPEYQQLKQIAIDGDYTLEQVQGVTRAERKANDLLLFGLTENHNGNGSFNN